MRRLFCATIFSIFSCDPAIADTARTNTGILQGSDVLSSSFRMIWGLLIVLGVILILYALLKKRFSLFANPANKEINVLEIKPLLGKKALCLVEVRGQEYLLGISDAGITNIASLGSKKNPGRTFHETLQEHTGESQ